MPLRRLREMSKEHVYYRGDIRISESERGKCIFCGEPADIKIGLWGYLKPMAHSDEQGWEEILICGTCNKEQKYVAENTFYDHLP